LRWARHVASREKCLRSLGKGTGRETPLGRPRSGWDDTVIVDLKDIGEGA
jgi:hypothetical protein